MLVSMVTYTSEIEANMLSVMIQDLFQLIIFCCYSYSGWNFF